jgi:polar amino acid transport system substrate-binding protein
LAIGRLSGAVLQTVTGDQLLRSDAFPTLERVDPPVAIKDYYLVISKTYAHDNPVLTEKLWENIAELRDEMSYQLMQKYTN